MDYLSDMTFLLDSYRPLCRALVSLLPGELEVVLHDLATHRIAHIENPLSPRRAGDSSLIEGDELDFEVNEAGFLGPYAKRNSDGAEMKSVSIPIKDERGNRVGLLCINMRLEKFAEAERLLSSLCAIANPGAPQALMQQDWRENAHDLLRKTLTERDLSLVAAKRADKIAILSAFDQACLFDYRGSADYIATMLGISRASLYALLKEARRAPLPNPPDKSNGEI